MSVAVAAGYTHVPKVARPGTLLSVGDAILKWYEVAPAGAPVPHAVREIAYESLCREWELADDLGFAVLHRCGRAFYFLLVSTWRNDNELWETHQALKLQLVENARRRAAVDAEAIRDLATGRERLRLEELQQLEQAGGRRQHGPSQAQIEDKNRPI